MLSIRYLCYLCVVFVMVVLSLSLLCCLYLALVENVPKLVIMSEMKGGKR